jgi:hypothetical protein
VASRQKWNESRGKVGRPMKRNSRVVWLAIVLAGVSVLLLIIRSVGVNYSDRPAFAHDFDLIGHNYFLAWRLPKPIALSPEYDLLSDAERRCIVIFRSTRSSSSGWFVRSSSTSTVSLSRSSGEIIEIQAETDTVNIVGVDGSVYTCVAESCDCLEVMPWGGK